MNPRLTDVQLETLRSAVDLAKSDEYIKHDYPLWAVGYEIKLVETARCLSEPFDFKGRPQTVENEITETYLVRTVRREPMDPA